MPQQRQDEYGLWGRQSLQVVNTASLRNMDIGNRVHRIQGRRVENSRFGVTVLEVLAVSNRKLNSFFKLKYNSFNIR